MKILVGLGIRADIPNLSVLLEKLCEVFGKENIIVVHSGQHYSYELDKIFFDELNVKEPQYHLEIGSNTQGFQTAETIRRSEEVILKEKPDLLISFSDGNPALMAITATKNFVKVAHIESGMRSMDWRMPEEKNRRIIDSISDILFCPTEIAYGNLRREGIADEKIFVSGKLIIDALEKFKDRIDNSTILERLGIRADEYFVSTLHRPENVEDYYNLCNLLEGLNLISKEFEKPIIAPLHPRTVEAIKKFNIKVAEGIHIINPLGFFDFVKLEKYCLSTITDSGTVEEETCWYRKPCVTVRPSTEREETVICGSNILVGERDGTFNPISILRATQTMVERDRDWEIPYEKGASERISRILQKKENEILKKKIWW